MIVMSTHLHSLSLRRHYFVLRIQYSKQSWNFPALNPAKMCRGVWREWNWIRATSALLPLIQEYDFTVFVLEVGKGS
jgi:hypothetical protein